MQNIFKKKVKSGSLDKNVPCRTEIFKNFSGKTEKAFCTFVYESIKSIVFDAYEFDPSLTGRNITYMTNSIIPLRR